MDDELECEKEQVCLRCGRTTKSKFQKCRAPGNGKCITSVRMMVTADIPRDALE